MPQSAKKNPTPAEQEPIKHPVAAALGLVLTGALVTMILGGLTVGLSSQKQ